MKKLLILLSLIMSNLVALAQNNSSELTITTQPALVTIAQKNKSVTLTCTAEKGESTIAYQWYITTEKKNFDGVAIDGANSFEYTTDVFSNREIRYYYCVATVEDESVTSDVAAAAYTGLPLLYINTEEPIASITKEAYVFGDMNLIYESGEEFKYTFKKEKDGEKKEGIKGRGNSSWSWPKKGYSIKFDKKQSLFGLPESKKWCIVANYTDKTLLHNKIASILGIEIFNSDWNGTFINVDVIWNGNYQGNYILCERNVIGTGRIDIQDIADYSEENVVAGKFSDQNGDNVVDLYDGGFVLEIDQRDDASFAFLTTHERHVTLKDPEDVTEEMQNHIKNIVQGAEDVLYGSNYTDLEEGWRKYFDEYSAIDWYIVNLFATNPDMNFSSIYRFYNPKDGKIHFGPNWDFDSCFGNRSENGTKPIWEDPARWYSNEWINQMLTDSLFVTNFIKRWNDKKDELQNVIDIRIQELADMNVVSADCNFIKWDILGRYIWPNNSGAEDRKTYQSEIDYMKNWITTRFAWMDDVLNKSFFITYNLKGGTLSTPNTKVFLPQKTSEFTLNNPTKEGYVFAGWSGTGISGLSKSVKVTDDNGGNKLFTANWNRDLDFCEVKLSATEFKYSGTAITPTIIVKDGDYTLVENTDYTVSMPGGRINTGDYVIEITGKDAYEGTVEKTFTINPNIDSYGALTILIDQDGKHAVLDGNSTSELSEITSPIAVKDVVFERQFSVGKPSTIVLPFSTSSYSGGTFYTFTDVSYDEDDSKWYADLTEETSEIVAHKPYIFIPSAESLTFSSGVTIEKSPEKEMITPGKNTNWTFKGVYAYNVFETVTGKEYGFAGKEAKDGNIDIAIGDFVHIGAGAKIKPFRCYLTFNGGSLSKSAIELPSSIEVRIVEPVATVESVEISEEGTSADAFEEDILTPISEISHNNDTKVWSYGKTIFIEAQPKTDYQIFDINGRILKTAVTSSDHDEVSLSHNVGGIAIVRIANKSYKVKY
ncbi:MAG: CotH kinase family protein [Bacteroidales bacterium]|nr:CotH kinase family protein [Bacteroidales bacterium]